MQVGSGVMRKMEGSVVEELQDYLALHVSFAHITPSTLAQSSDVSAQVSYPDFLSQSNCTLRCPIS